MTIGAQLGWKKPMATVAAAGVLAALTAAAGPAQAGGRVFLGFNLGVPVYGPPAYYPPPPAYYYPPPVYYPPPPVVMAPNPVPPVAQVAPQAPAGVSQENCREYQSTTVIGGRTQPIVGTACLQPDGTWRIVR